VTDAATLDDYGTLTEPATLTIERLLPGPIERCWAYLTDGKLRARWLAAGEMELKVGAPFELVWRNGELNDPPSPRPADFPEEHRMQGRILAVDAPRALTISWGANSEVAFTLEPVGQRVKLTIVHSRVPDRSVLLNVSAGWHAHLDVLAARLCGGGAQAPFWQAWQQLKAEYDRRFPA
jgi:uncharacterized protein YndB with AHSA1/START domain